MADLKDSSVKNRSPWVKIWFEPRETIRKIVNTDVKQCFLILAAIYGLPLAFNLVQSFAISTLVPVWAILLGSLILCTFVGMIGIYVTSWLLEFTGKWIGGKASFLEIRAAFAWSNVPTLVSILMWVLLLGMFGGQVFDRDFAQMQFVGYEAGVLFLVMLVEMVISVWGFIILLNTLAEVQKFSVWRALLNVLIPFVGVLIIIWFIGWAVYGR
jgi:hypothetical protein